MDFQLEPEHIQIQDTVRKFCHNEVIPYAEEWERDEIFPRETIRHMGELGFFASPFLKSTGERNSVFWPIVLSLKSWGELHWDSLAV